ncbi:PKD domain-containing protein [Halorussus pelagicus]|uniref:PKD domain-containing protein n=1 Tax=Halorussus pelagicus TaxID=2505977 RepID=UPI00140E29F4|nr:PKD domain-containing protein [Halorussus pelagicus]
MTPSAATATAANDTLTASISFSPDDPAPDDTITFDGSDSTAPGTIEEYEWDLDGDEYVEEDGATVTTAFDSAGTYTVTLWVTDDEGETDETTVTVSVENDAPKAAFSYSPNDPAPDDTITFDAGESSDPDGRITDYEWDLDGDDYVEESGSTVTTSFETGGTYTVTLWVTDNGDRTVRKTKTVEVGNSAPKASFDYSPGEPAPDDTITLDAGDSTDADGRITDYEWDLDNDEYVEESGSTVTTSFETGGTYTVTLWVTDNGERTTRQTKTIEVDNAAPNTTFSYSPSNPSPDDTIEFDAGSSADPDGKITDYEWDLDNDEYVEEHGSTVTTSFETAGTYPVTLWVTDNGDRTVKTVKRIRVNNSAPDVSADYSPSNPSPGDTVTFDAGGSTDPDGKITDYEWDLDDDEYVEESGSQASYTFEEEGVHSVTLWVTDNGDRTVKKTLRVPVGDVTTTPAASETSSGVASESGTSFANGEWFQVARLYTPEKVVEPGDPGRLAGAFTADVTNQKPIKVQITLQVPSGLRVQGGSDVQSSGGGLPTATFVVDPGETKDISAEVSGSDPGTYTLRAAITYFPVENTSAAREHDDLTMNFEVRDESAEAPIEDESNTGTDGEGTSSGDTPGFSVGATVLALLAAAMVARRAE